MNKQQRMKKNKLFHSSKKGFLGEAYLFLFYRFIIVGLVAVAMVLLVKTYIVTEIDIQETQMNLFMYNMLNSKDGLSYYDEDLERTFPGIISVAAFQDTAALEEKLDARMDYGEQQLIASELTLFTADEEKIGTAYYNKDWYERWIILARTFWKGKGSTTEYTANKTVLLLHADGTKNPGILQFSIVMPNS